MSEKILEGFVHYKMFAEEADKSPRTVIRWMDQPDGLPYVKVGRDRFIPVDRGRGWLRSRIVQRNPRGR